MSKFKFKSGFVIAMVAVGLGLASLTLMRLFADTPPPPYYVVIDQNGANDLSSDGQNDLTKMGRYDDPNGTPGDPSDDVLDLFWSWDETGFSGQSGDACAQFGVPGAFDTDVAFVVCGQVHGQGTLADPVKLSSVYTKKCDNTQTNSADRCVSPIDPVPGPQAGDILAGDYQHLDPNGVLITNDDPFPTGNGYPGDSTLRMRIRKSFLPAGAKLLNVCTFGSAGSGGNTDPKDCIANDGGGFLVIKKNVNADLGAQFQFNLTGLPSGQSNPYTVIGGSSFAVGLPEGTHDITEVNIPSGWTFNSASCTAEDGTSTGSINGTTVSGVQITAGLFTTCTYTNSAQLGTLTLVKVVNNNNGGTKTQADFTPTIDGVNAVWGANSNIALGQRTVSEAASAGYTMVSISGDCDASGKVTIGPGQSKTCTITNDDNKPSLTLTKNVTNNNGGTASATDFTLTATGPTSISGAGGVSSGNDFSVGTYTLSETNLPGYTAGAWSCVKNGGAPATGSSITLALGDSAACSVNNDDQPGTLIVKKVVINDNGGTKKATDFSFKIGSGSPVAFSQDGANALAGKNTLTMNAGTYSITEPAVVGYTTTYDGCSNIVLGNGDTKTCTITNDDQPGTLIVQKVVVNNNGGTSVATDFSFQVNNESAVAFLQDTDTLHGKNTLTRDAGTYNVAEPAVSGYTTTYNGCSNIALGNGDTKTCTITNDDQQGTLIVKKVVVNNNGGTRKAVDFGFKVNNGSAVAFLQDGANALAGKNTLALDAGTYTVTEPASAGYASSYSGDCSAVSLSIGQTRTCTITNDDIAPSLVLIKFVDNNTLSNDGTKVATDFVLTANGPTPISGAGGASSPGTFSAGSYTLSESLTLGYATLGWSCVKNNGIPVQGNTIALALADNAVCSIINSAINLPPTITVDKSSSPGNLPQSGGVVTFTVKVTNTSSPTDPFTLTSLVDDVYGDLTLLVESGKKDQLSTTCSLPQLIAPGGSYTCQFTASFAGIPDNTTYSEHDTVTASGVDDDNAGASSIGTASDDAFVVQSPPIAVTDSSLCYFDTTPGGAPRTFKRLFTQDALNMPYFRLTATNPGQFYYNLSLSGTPGTNVHVKLELPWPFITQGAMPIHVYDGVGLKSLTGGAPGPTDFCFIPGNETAAINQYVVLPNYGVAVPTKGGVPDSGYVGTPLAPKTAVLEFDITIPATGFAYINQHLDDGLKGPKVDVDGDGTFDTILFAKGSNDNALYPTSSGPNLGKILIPELTKHDFKVTWTGGAVGGGEDWIYNDNEFKKNTGVAGRITVNDQFGAAIPGLQVNLYKGYSTSPANLVGSAVTDVDGWYTISYKATGKEAPYTVYVPSKGAAIVPTANPTSPTLKANGFKEVDFYFAP